MNCFKCRRMRVKQTRCDRVERFFCPKSAYFFHTALEGRRRNYRDLASALGFSVHIFTSPSFNAHVAVTRISQQELAHLPLLPPRRWEICW